MKKEQPKKSPPTIYPDAVVSEIKYGNIETKLEYFGRVGTFRSTDLVAEVQGQLKEVGVALKPGLKIGQGQLLCRIDDTETRLNLQSQKSQFQKSIADNLADLKIDFPDKFEEWLTYFESIDVEKPLKELPKITSTKEKTFFATKGILSAYYSILSAEERLGKYSVYAPFSGSVSEVYAEPGSVVNPGTKIAKVSRTDKLELVLPVRPSDISWVMPGTDVVIRSEDEKFTWNGRVARIGEKLEPRTQSVNVYVTIFQDKDQPLFDGQYLQATIPGATVKDAIEIPRKALFKNSFVYLIREENKLASHNVSLHKLNPETAVISGLKEGELLVIDPPVTAEEGLEVNIQQK